MKIIITALLLASTSCFAVETPIKTTATVQPTCQLAVKNTDFGLISQNTHNAAFSDIKVKCSRELSYTIVFGAGQSNDTSARYMTTPASTDKLYYYMLHEATDTRLGDDPLALQLSSDGDWQALNYEVIVSSNQYIAPGIYTDNVMVSVNY